MDFVDNSDYRTGGHSVVCLKLRGIQSLAVLVQRLSFRRITCPAHLSLLELALVAAYPFFVFVFVGGTQNSLSCLCDELLLGFK